MRKTPNYLFRITLVIVLSFVSVRAIAQDITLKIDNQPLNKILTEITELTGYKFVYSSAVQNKLDVLGSIDCTNSTIKSVLDQLLKGNNISYKIEGKNIALAPSEMLQLEVSGVVRDNNGNGIPYVSVNIKGTNSVVETNADGSFTIMTSVAAGELVVSCIGYETKSVKFNSRASLKIVLNESVNELDEVAVVAYGERKTREVVGSISSVKLDNVKNLPAASVQNILQGQMAGVEVTNLSGGPGGGGAQITIRGFNSLGSSSGGEGIVDGSPLFVIDGVPVKSSPSVYTGGINTLAGLDIASIKSVEVLKDAASASLYGSRAGNGVVLITTKKGKTGKAQFSAKVTNSVSILPETPVQIAGKGERYFHALQAIKQRIGHADWMTDKVITPENYKDTWGWAATGDGSYDFFWKNGNIVGDWMDVPSIAQDSLNTFYNNTTNWWDYAFRTGRITDASLQVSGGSENTQYLINGGVYDEKGIMLGSSFLRASLLTNLDLKLTPKLEGFLRMNFAYTDRSAGSDNGKLQGLTFDPKGTSTLLPGKGSTAERETLRQLKDIKRKNANYNIRINGGINYNIWKGINFSSSNAVDHYFTHSYVFTPNYLTASKLSEVQANNYAMTMIQSENLLTYKTNINNKHNIDLLAGITYNRDLLQLLGGTAKGGPTNQIIYVGEGWPKLKEFDGYTEHMQTILTNRQEQRLISYLGRVAYNYKQRYIFEASIRRDGSSVFGSNVRWGTFPSTALGWVFSEEKFLKSLYWLNFAKLRLSWGRSGQKFDNAYLAHGVMDESNTFFGSLGLMPSFMANNKLSWEKTDQYNIGLDMDMFNYALKFKVDYYYKYSDDLLMQTAVPGNFFLADKMWNNSSAISNEGIEFETTINVLRRGNFKWTTSFNISRNWNMLRKTYNNIDLNDKVLGRPIYGIYTYNDEGIIQQESEIPYYYDQFGSKKALYFQSESYPIRVGARKIKDQNGDGVIDTKDRYYAGSTLPKAHGGWINILQWKNLTLTAIMNYSISRKVMNMVKNSAFQFDGDFGVIMNDYRNVSFWQKPGDNAKYPALEFADSGYIGQYDGDIDSNIENVSFVRLRQLNISYNLPKRWLGKIGVEDVNLFLSGENLYILTNYSGLDPEIIDQNTGKDTGNMYPLSRSFTLGLNIKF